MSFTHLVPKRPGHLVDDGAQFPVLPGVADVGPGAERDQRQAQDHVAQAGDDVHAYKACDARRHVHDEDDHEERGRRARGVENVLGVVVLDVLDEHLVDLALQLLQVAAAELLAAHLLDAAEELQGLLPDGQVSVLQLAGGQEGPVAPADLCREEGGLTGKEVGNLALMFTRAARFHRPPPFFCCTDPSPLRLLLSCWPLQWPE